MIARLVSQVITRWVTPPVPTPAVTIPATAMEYLLTECVGCFGVCTTCRLCARGSAAP